MNDAIPAALARARAAQPEIRASWLVVLGIRALGVVSANWFAPCAIAAGAIAAFWGLPPR